MRLLLGLQRSGWNCAERWLGVHPGDAAMPVASAFTRRGLRRLWRLLSIRADMLPRIVVDAL
jgi:hypothetical protein